MPRRKGAPEVNAGSMADIAFLLLIFFLVTTTIETDAGLDRMLPPIEPPDTDVVIKQKNIFTVNINKNGQLLVEEQLMSLEDLNLRLSAFHREMNLAENVSALANSSEFSMWKMMTILDPDHELTFVTNPVALLFDDLSVLPIVDGPGQLSVGKLLILLAILSHIFHLDVQLTLMLLVVLFEGTLW